MSPKWWPKPHPEEPDLPKRVPAPPVTTPDVASVRLSETERLRAALAPFVRAWRAAEARGAGADLMAFEPVRLVDRRNAAWAAEEDGDGE